MFAFLPGLVGTRFAYVLVAPLSLQGAFGHLTLCIRPGYVVLLSRESMPWICTASPSQFVISTCMRLGSAVAEGGGAEGVAWAWAGGSKGLGGGLARRFRWSWRRLEMQGRFSQVSLR